MDRKWLTLSCVWNFLAATFKRISVPTCLLLNRQMQEPTRSCVKSICSGKFLLNLMHVPMIFVISFSCFELQAFSPLAFCVHKGKNSASGDARNAELHHTVCRQTLDKSRARTRDRSPHRGWSYRDGYQRFESLVFLSRYNIIWNFITHAPQ